MSWLLLVLIITAILLLGLGFTFFFTRRVATPKTACKHAAGSKPPPVETSLLNRNGHFHPIDNSVSTVCPVCSAALPAGERVHSTVFPPEGDRTRMMHILGCVYCLAGEGKRVCPVCGLTLSAREPLVARVFERPGRTHVHVLGCAHCRAKPQ
ncbi:MAG: hypothetical protein LBS86_05905 [Treponema sp.]|jgi:hypothetical protein|nr:hypothetical protein [Treponema sp.]